MSGERRWQALEALELVGRKGFPNLDQIACLASELTGRPKAAISLLDETRQWFISSVGLDVSETPIEDAFCLYAIESPEGMQVANAFLDERFRDNPLVNNEPFITAYSGAPLTLGNGIPLGTICVFSPEPGLLDDEQLKTLFALSDVAAAQIELQHASEVIEAAEQRQAGALAILRDAIQREALDLPRF